MKSQRGYRKWLNHLLWGTLVAVSCAALAVCPAFAVTDQNPPAVSAPATVPPLQVEGINWRVDAGNLLIDVKTSGAPAFKTFELRNPHRIVVDVLNSRMNLKRHRFVVDQGQVRYVRVAQFSNASPKIVRAVFDLSEKIPYRVVREGNNVRMIVPLPSVAAAKVSTNAPESVAPKNPIAATEKPKPTAGLIDSTNRPATVIRGVETRMLAGNLVVSIHSDGVLQYKSFELERPPRVVVDLLNVNLRSAHRTFEVKQGGLSTIRVGQFLRGKNPTVRVVMDESKKSEYKVDSTSRGLNFVFAVAAAELNVPSPGIRDAAKIETPAPIRAAAPPETKPKESVVAVVADVNPVDASGERKAEKPAVFPLTVPDPAPASPPIATLPVSAPETWMAMPKTLVPPFKPEISLEQISEIKRPDPMVQLEQYESIHPLDSIEVNDNPPVVPTQAKTEAVEKITPPTVNTVVDPLSIPAAQVKTEAAETIAPPPTKTVLDASSTAPSQTPASFPAVTPAQEKATQPPAPKTTAKPVPPSQPTAPPTASTVQALEAQTMPTAPATAPPGATTNPNDIISLDLRDVDIRDFFRLIHEVSGLNVVLDPSVRGTLTIALKDVPWEQALDIVLQNNQLGKQLEGNVLRITTLRALEDEQNQRRKILESQRAEEEAAQRQTFIRIPNYLRAQDVANVFQQLLSSKYGKGTEDSVLFFGANAAQQQQNKPVNNVVIVHTTPQKMAELDAILKTIDVKSQQVEIEARVVAANRTFLRDLGVQLGIQTFSKSLNNIVSGLPALNSPLVRAPRPPVSSTTPQTSSGALSTGPLPLNMNLGAANPTSGLGYIYSGSNALLDAFISAAEAKGTAKVLSKPKFITQNYREGMVMQGVKVPFQTVVNNTVTNDLKDAALTLRVTPQITRDGNIILDADIKNDSPDFTNLVLGQPTIQTQEITTKVMIGDGQTVVIGGVMLDRNSINYRQVPGLGDIPVIGNLFKNKTVQNTTQELLFFLTPKILN